LYSAASSITVICRVLADVSSLEKHFKTRDCPKYTPKESHAIRRCVGKFSEEHGSARVEVQIHFFFSSVRSLGAGLQKLCHEFPVYSSERKSTD
jgi:hypothetical protein